MGRKPSLKDACIDCRTILQCMDLGQCKATIPRKRRKLKRKPGRPRKARPAP